MPINAIGNINESKIEGLNFVSRANLKAFSNVAFIDPSILSNTASITFDPDGSYKDVSIWTSTGINTWEPSAGTYSWMTFSSIVQRNANGWGSFRVTAPKNETANRSGEIKIISRFNPNLTINTSQNKSAPADYIYVQGDVIGNLTWLRGENINAAKQVNVSCPGTWTATIISNPYNIISSMSYSGSPGSTNISVKNRTTKEARTASIRYTYGSAAAVLYVCIEGTISGDCGGAA